ncbi:hypothetical protein EW146_g1254 [Bondarzewia mesenterica]|uniref:Zn(2)-C6 fungal-type domain-containing protein n=1 Tax=Bondarzewia mesenterica TaxID=1095465 RepID=A0A4S4MAN7_9AGAM|nr:hypothetical protein EW146_g1254 [Bondarzewia mesenterica]
MFSPSTLSASPFTLSTTRPRTRGLRTSPLSPLPLLLHPPLLFSPTPCVQTSILPSSFTRRHQAESRAYILDLVKLLLGELVTTATAMGFHRDPGRSRMPFEVTEHRRWAWWHVLLLERWQAFMFGRPLAIASHHFDMELPSYCDPALDATGHLYDGNIALFKLAYILGTIMDDAISLCPVTYAVLAKDRLLQEWIDALPPPSTSTITTSFAAWPRPPRPSGASASRACHYVPMAQTQRCTITIHPIASGCEHRHTQTEPPAQTVLAGTISAQEVANTPLYNHHMDQPWDQPWERSAQSEGFEPEVCKPPGQGDFVPYLYSMVPNQVTETSNLAAYAEPTYTQRYDSYHNANEQICEVYGTLDSRQGGGYSDMWAVKTAYTYHSNTPYEVANTATIHGQQVVLNEPLNVAADGTYSMVFAHADPTGAAELASGSALYSSSSGQHVWPKEMRSRHGPPPIYSESVYPDHEHYPNILNHPETELARALDNAESSWHDGQQNLDWSTLVAPDHGYTDLNAHGNVLPTSAGSSSLQHALQSCTPILQTRASPSPPHTLACSPTPMGHLPYPSDAEPAAGSSTGITQWAIREDSPTRHAPIRNTCINHEVEDIVKDVGDVTAASTSTESGPRRGRVRVVKTVQPIACFFCRKRKIACRPADPDSLDKTCGQCLKRDRKCVHPTESNRGRRRNTLNNAKV